MVAFTLLTCLSWSDQSVRLWARCLRVGWISQTENRFIWLRNQNIERGCGHVCLLVILNNFRRVWNRMKEFAQVNQRSTSYSMFTWIAPKRENRFLFAVSIEAVHTSSSKSQVCTNVYVPLYLNDSLAIHFPSVPWSKMQQLSIEGTCLQRTGCSGAASHGCRGVMRNGALLLLPRSSHIVVCEVVRLRCCVLVALMYRAHFSRRYIHRTRRCRLAFAA